MSKTAKKTLLLIALLTSFSAFAQTSVRDLVPSSAPAGARVMVTGRGLADPALAVAFAPGTSAAVVQRHDRYIEVVVPANAASGNVRVTSGATLVAELPFTVSATPKYVVSTLAGGKDSKNTPLKHPWGAAVVLPEGTIAVADEQHHRILMVTAAGPTTVLAGGNKQGFTNGRGAAAEFKSPRGIAFDAARRVLYVSDTGNAAIREVALDGTVKTLAGSGKQGFVDGTGAAAEFRDPHGLTVGADGAIYVTDPKNFRIRRVTTAGVVTTFAGNGQRGTAVGDGALLSATFNEPRGIVAAGNDFYVADTKNNAIRKISGGQVTTVLSFPRTGEDDDPADSGDGNANVLNRPAGIGMDESGFLIVSDSENDFIRRIDPRTTPATMVTIAGTGKNGWVDGDGAIAQFKDPVGLTVAGAIYVADEDNDALRRLCPEVRLTGLYSPSGAVTAGTEVRLFGTGFVPGLTTVQIGGAAATGVTWISSTELAVKLPQNITGGSVSVTIVSCAGTAGPVSFVVDNTAPVITVTQGGTPLVDGSLFRVPVTPVIAVTDDIDPAPRVTITLNGAPFVSGTTVSVDAFYTLVVTAEDAAGNRAERTVKFVVLTAPASLVILEGTTPLHPNSLFNRAVVLDTAFTGFLGPTVVMQIDGQPYTAKTPYSVEGTHNVTARATDSVGGDLTAGPIPFTIDLTPPVLTYTSHTNNQVLSSRDVTIVGGTDDAVTVSVNGIAATVDTTAKTFTLPFTLVEGENTLVATGTDRAGNVGTATLKLRLDSRAPELTVAAVAACVRTETLELRGTVADPALDKVVVKLDGTTTNAVVTGGAWSATIALPTEGSKSILVEATDSTGHVATEQVTVTVDRTAPQVEISESGGAFTATLVPRPVALFVRSNETSATVTATLGTTAYASGTEIAAEGTHTIRVTARDCAGNESSREHTFAIDLTPPRFLTFTPASGTKVSELPGSLSGTVSDDAVEVRAKGIAVPATNGAFTIPNIGFTDGVNDLALEVVDRAGHTGRGSYTIGIRTSQPLVDIVEGGEAMVNGTVYRRTVEPRVRVFEDGVTFTATLNGAPFTNGTTVSANGQYTISATATDPAFNQSSSITRTFTIDRSGPEVVIVSPVDGASIDADRTDVRVTAGDSVRVVINTVAATKGSDNVWTANVPLEIGENVIVATGTDAAGNSGSDSADVTRGTAGPAIVLTFPPDNHVTNRPRLDVTGRVLRPNSSVAVTVPPSGAASAAVDPAGMFRLSGAELQEGEWTITAVATEGGKSTSAAVRVIADFTPPHVRILESGSPLADSAHFPTQAVITGVATDKGQPVNYSLVVDGNPVANGVTISATGGHTAVITATDAAGNQARLERTFYVGSSAGGGCLLDVESFDPRDGTVLNAQKVELIGRSGGAAGVKANGVAAKMSNGSFCVPVELPQEGVNTVTIVCTDAAGNPTGDPKVITLYRATNDPSITITTPAEDSVSQDETIVVTGTLGNGAISVDVNGKPATINGSNWTVTDVRLQDGVNVLVAHAKNASGRAASASRRVTYLQELPAIAISSPIAGFVTGRSKTDVSGTFSNVVPSSIAVTGVAGAVTPEAWSDTTGRFVGRDVPLQTGDNTIVVTGLDRTGRIARAEVVVRYTPNLPLIDITSPADNHYYGGAQGNTFRVEGTFTAAAGSSVDVNGVAATISGNTFSADIPFSNLPGGLTPVIARVAQPSGDDGAFDSLRVFKLAEAPKVLSVFPPANEIGVDPGAVVLVLFSAPMERASTIDAFRLENAAGTAIGGKVYLDKDVLTFAPGTTLTAGERYTIKVAGSAKDLAGQSLTPAHDSAFTVATTAPSTAPTLTTKYYGSYCGNTIDVAGTAAPGARLRLDYGQVFFTTTATPSGTFSYKIPLSGQQGYHVIRVRTMGADGTLSPFVELKLNVDCAGPRVLGATYNRNVNTLTIVFNRDVKAETVNSSTVLLERADGTLASGTIVTTGANAVVTPSPTLVESTFTLKVTTGVQDTAGRNVELPHTQLFPFGDEQPQPGDGRGYITGEVYDATTGRPLAGAAITIEAPTAAFARGGVATNATAATQAVTMITDARGRYSDRFPEGAHTIKASANGYTTVWRQIIVPAGAGVIPIDIRLTRRGTSLVHGGDKVARRAELTLAGTGTATITSTGAQSLAGLLPLGWSPLASAVISTNDTITGQLTFDVPQSELTQHAQSLTAVRYDDSRDEWRVLVPVVNVNNNKATFDVSGAGAYALVYADRAPKLKTPPAPVTGAVLQGAADPCATGACPELIATSFPLDPAVVLPSESTVATLNIRGTDPHLFPSGTAVQAYIDEELRLVDGGRELDPPFATDLLLYRNLAGDLGVAAFNLAPSPRAAEVTLEVGFDHIRILPYPGRLDRGTLVGPEGGRVPADEKVSVEIPTGATQAELRATATSIADAQSLGPIAGFTIVGGLQLSLQQAATTPDLDGDGKPDAPAPVELTKPARATFSLTPQQAALGTQFVLVELLDRTPFGQRVFRLAAVMQAVDATRWTTKSIDREQLPVDGIVREGRYLLLAANAPVAFAKGLVRLGAGGPAAADARVTTPALGVADLSRLTGIFNVVVPATPAAPFQLTPRSATLGDGATYTHTSSPAANAVVNVGDLLIVAQPPQIASTIPAANATNVNPATTVEVTLTPGIDATSVNATTLTVIDTTTGTTVAGTVTAVGNLGVRWAMPSGDSLRAGTRYTVAVAPSLRGTNGTPLGQAHTFSFTTAAVVTSNELHPERVHITIPDANGTSRITGLAGALKTGWLAVPVRRNRDFMTRYSVVANADGSFALTIGTDPRDRLTIADEIDLRVLNNAGALAAIIPLTPFVSEDGKAFVAPARRAVTFTSAEGITVSVPADAFDVATYVEVAKTTAAVFAAVPNVSQELDIVSAVEIRFEGRARRRLDVKLPLPAGVTAADNKFFLGILGQSSRGPRIQAVDPLFAVNGTLSTAPTSASSATDGLMNIRTNEVTRGNAPRDLVEGVIEAGKYAAAQFREGVAANGFTWALLDTYSKIYELYWDTLQSLYVGHRYVAERGRVVFPVPSGRAFRVTGVDPATSLTLLDQAFGALPVGDSGTVATLPTPENDLNGPHVIFGSPFRIESAEVPPPNVSVEVVRGVQLLLSDSGQLNISPAAGATGVLVNVLNVNTGERRDELALPYSLSNVKPGHRLIFAIEEKDIDPSTPVSIVFSEPIDLGAAAGGSEEEVSDALKELIKLEQAPDITADGSDMLGAAILRLDSNGRRVTFLLPSPLPAAQKFRVVVKMNVKDTSTNGLRLGQAGEKNSGGAIVPIGPPPDDMVFWFRTRGPHGKIAEFDIRQSGSTQVGYIRDVARYDNLLFVAAVDGGILAYDVSDPAKLNAPDTKPLAFAPGLETGSATAYWNVQVDHHGRVITTGMGHMFGALRTFRVEDFINAPGAPGCNADYTNEVCNQTGGGMISQNPGTSYVSGLHSAAVVDDRVEAIPRKIKVVIGDSEPMPYTRDQLAALATSVSGPADGLQVMQLEIPASGSSYRIQRITIENVTLGLRWSADAKANSDAPDLDPAQFKNVVAGPNDVLRVTHNLSTHAVVTLFGYGIGVFDVNAFESNDREQAAGSDPDARPREQIALRKFAIPPPPVPEHITDLNYSPDVAIAPASSGALRVYALDHRRGAAEFTVVLPDSISLRGETVLTANNPRWDALRAAANDIGLTKPVLRFNSVALYRNTTTKNDYLLLPALDLGLIVVHASAPLTQESFADVIWFPKGAYSVSVVERSNLAIVADGEGAVHLVDLSRLDERQAMVAGAPLLPTALFPTAAAAIDTPGTYGYGSPDPRILWRSEPGIAKGQIPVLMDPDTGIFYTGELLTQKVQIGSAVDPRIRFTADYGDNKGPREVNTIVPLGIEPPPNVLKCKLADDPDNCRASLGAFRVEVALPGSIDESMTGDLAIAIESQRLPGVAAPQTPDLLPLAHLRARLENGSPSLRPTTMNLRRVLDVPSAPELRYQRGWNRFVSDWVVALADPRAAEDYTWGSTTPAQKIDLGCFACERPKYIADDPDAKELYTAGRFISVRPDITTGPYSWIGDNGRMRTRVSTTIADTVRPANVLVAAQNPPVATGMLQETVYLHSGEVETSAIDLDAGGRAGWNVIVDRTYRSRTLGRTALGFGWDSALFKRLRALPTGDVEYRDGSGEVFLYRVVNGAYESPKGYFQRLARTDTGWVLTDQKRRLTYFDQYGRVTREGDEFYTPDGKGNQIVYVYDSNDQLDAVVDANDRVSTVDYDTKGQLKTFADWRQRVVTYNYDTDGRLAYAVLPQFTPFGAGPITPEREYTYDTGAAGGYANKLELSTNLLSIVDPNEAVSGASVGSPARVTFTYTGPRDFVKTQKWGTPGGESATFDFTVPTPTSFPTAVKTTDVLGQVRNYTLKTPSAPAADQKPQWYAQDRVHIDTLREMDVEVYRDAAFGALPTTLVAGPAPVETKTREFTFKYEDDGLLDLLTLNGASTTQYTYASAGPGFGKMLDCKAIGAPGTTPCTGSAVVRTQQNYSGTYLDSSTANGKTLHTKEPHRGRTTVSNENNDITTTTTYDPTTGLPKEITTAGGTGGDPTNTRVVIQYPSGTTNALYKRGLAEKIILGSGGVETKYDYVSQTLTRVNTGRNTTETTLDEYQRPVSVKTTNNFGDPLVLTETFRYDASGRLKKHTRLQTTNAGDETVATEYGYDLVGRVTRVEMNNVNVNGTASSVATTTNYNEFPTGIVKVMPPGNAEITTRLDRLGRIKESKQRYATDQYLTDVTAYDLADHNVYESDLKLATAFAYDAADRLVDVRHLDGSKQKRVYDGFNHLTGLHLLDSAGNEYFSTINNLTDGGKIISVTDSGGTANRTTTQEWDAAGRPVKIVSGASGATDSGRATFMKFDDAGRLLSSESGEGTTSSLIQVFERSLRSQYGSTTLARRIDRSEPNTTSPVTYSVIRDFDTMGRARRVTVGALEWNNRWDQRGRVIQSALPGRPLASYEYDSRGRLIKETLANGSTRHHEHNDSGARVIKLDEESEQTRTSRDFLGRPLVVTYADSTTEEYRYDGARMTAVKNRQDQWQSYEFNNKGQLVGVWAGPAPVAGGTQLDKIGYDDAGRVVSWRNKDVLVEYSDFTIDAIPTVTTQTRFKNGSGFDTADVLDTYTVGHTFNGYGELTRLLMPVAAGPTWVRQLDMKYDAAGNLVELIRDGEVLLAGDYRNAGRPDSRTVTIQPESCATATCMKSLVREYSYDVATSRLDGMTAKLAGVEIAGSKVTHDEAGEITEEKLIGIGGDRYTRYSYDPVGRLFGSITGVSGGMTPPAPIGGGGTALPSAPGTAQEVMSPADFRKEQARNQMLDATAREELRKRGINPDDVDPPGSTALPRPGHKIDKFAKGPTPEDFKWQKPTGGEGALRTEDGRFRYGYDEKHRLLWVAEKALNTVTPIRRVLYAYDAHGRMVGRTAQFALPTTISAPVDSLTWDTENRAPVIAADGIPAELTFVWDPVTDRLLAVYKTGDSASPTDPYANLLKQFVHGDLGLDDPIEVTTPDVPGAVGPGAAPPVTRLYPVFDEAGNGTLQVVLNRNGEIVGRSLTTDPYGAEAFELSGAAVDRVQVTAKKTAAGDLESVRIRMRSTEALVAETIAGGAQISIVESDGTSPSPVVDATPVPDDAFSVEWNFTGSQWLALTGTSTTPGASVSIAATASLRAGTWAADLPVLAPPAWAQATNTAFSSATKPYELRESLQSLSTFIGNIPAGTEATTTPYEVEALGMLGASDGNAALDLLMAANFQAQPFADPFTGKNYVRARWYDPETGTFLTPDPKGDVDSSNLYAFAGGDPVNGRDPRGEQEPCKNTTMASVQATAEAGWEWFKGNVMETGANGVSILLDPLVGDYVWQIRQRADDWRRTARHISSNIVAAAERGEATPVHVIGGAVDRHVQNVDAAAKTGCKENIARAVTPGLLDLAAVRGSVDGPTGTKPTPTPALVPATGGTVRTVTNATSSTSRALPLIPQNTQAESVKEAFGEGPETDAIRIENASGAGVKRHPRHHVFPQEFRESGFWKERNMVGNFDIDNFTLELEEAIHQAIHGGGDHRLGRTWDGEWNHQIMKRIVEREKLLGRKLNPKELIDLAKDMMKEYGIDGDFVPFKDTKATAKKTKK